MAVQQTSPVVCQNCRAQFSTPVHQIVNGQDMAMKAAFLQGQLNAVQCPQCRSVSVPNIPVYYYDLEKELALVHVPTQLTLMGANQEQIIGNLANRLTNSLAKEQRKFYLFNPKPFLTLDSMVKAIYEADGITEEMLQTQQAKLRLIEEFLQTRDEASLKEKIKARDKELDRDFFELLTAYMQASQASGEREQAQTLFALRTLLARWSTNGRAIVKEIDQEIGLLVLESQDQLLEKLQQAQTQEERTALINAGHTLLDYTFFQKLTNKIDKAAAAGDAKSVKELTALRTTILETKERQEAEGRATVEKAAELLRKILQATNPETVIDKNLEKFDDAFFYVLSANLEEAQRQKQEQAVQVLGAVGNMVMAKLQERFGKNDVPADNTPDSSSPSEEKPTIHIASR